MLKDWQSYFNSLSEEDKKRAPWPCTIWMGNLEKGKALPHWHCTRCWGEEFYIKDLQKVCSKCPEFPNMVLCTPMICASS